MPVNYGSNDIKTTGNCNVKILNLNNGIGNDLSGDMTGSTQVLVDDLLNPQFIEDLPVQELGDIKIIVNNTNRDVTLRHLFNYGLDGDLFLPNGNDFVLSINTGCILQFIEKLGTGKFWMLIACCGSNTSLQY